MLPVDFPLGKLELNNGYPTEATVKKVYDDINFQRAWQAYLWALPLMAMQEWQREHRETFGTGNLDYVDYFTFEDKLGLLTAVGGGHDGLSSQAGSGMGTATLELYRRRSPGRRPSSGG